jgi:nitrogen fixation protein NifU and related proteins
MDLYAENILDHFKNPRHCGEDPEATILHKESNPSCGDDLSLFITLADDRMTDFCWNGQGCAISQASMSLLSETLIGKTLPEIDALSPADVLALLSVPVGPSRMKCALLSLFTVQNAIRIYRHQDALSFTELLEKIGE